MNKNAAHLSANYTHKIAISVHKCHSPDLIFKIIMKIKVQLNLTTVLKVIRRIMITLFSEAATGAAL